MLNFLGVSENLSVLADSRWVSTFLFTDEVTGEQAALDGVTFEGTVSVSEREEYALVFTRSSSDAQRHIVEVEVPPLPEGRWKYSIFVTHETGEKARLMYGYVTAVGAFIDTSGQSYANRTLEVKLPGDATKRIQLEWQASTVAQMAAKNALDAAERVADLQETAEDAVSKATEALGKLDKVEELVESAETAAGEAQEAANQAQEIVDAAPREYIPTIVGGYWYINGQNTGVKAEGEDGLDGSRVTRHLVNSVEELPRSGETCNSGHVYYVGLPDKLHTIDEIPSTSGEWNAWRIAADLIPHGILLSGVTVPGVSNSSTTAVYVAVYRRESNATRELLGISTEAKTWSSGQDVSWEFETPFEVPEGNGIEIYLAASLDAIGTNSATRPGVHIKTPYLNSGNSACRYDAAWYGARTPYLAFTSPNAGKVIVYEWFDGHGWVSLAGNAAQSLRPATATVDGVVKLGSELVIEAGAPVGVNADGQMQVPIANAVRMHRLFSLVRRRDDQLNSHLQDVLQGIKVVKTFGKEQEETNKFSKEAGKFADIQEKSEIFWAKFNPTMSFFLNLGTTLVLIAGGYKVLAGTGFTVGEMAQYISYANMLFGPLGWFTWLPRMLMDLRISLARIDDVMGQTETLLTEGTPVTKSIEGNIEFSGVTFGYRAYEPVLRDISFTVKAGESIGLVGSSGAGKSTMINLIMRLYDVDEGCILVDGQDIRSYKPENLHGQIGVVLQENYLFSGSVLENIRFAKPEATIEEVIHAAKVAGAHDFVCKFPYGYQTPVGEKGQRLSGGERQRIAIARAVLTNPKLLILDEATSSLDTESEFMIQKALERLKKGRTTFAIAHRLSTLKGCDRIFVIDDHKIAEMGSHEELMGIEDGIYKGLVEAQLEMHAIKTVEKGI